MQFKAGIFVACIVAAFLASLAIAQVVGGYQDFIQSPTPPPPPANCAGSGQPCARVFVGSSGASGGSSNTLSCILPGGASCAPTGGSGAQQCNNVVTFSSTPTFDFSICPLQTITLAGNISPIIANPQNCKGITCFVVIIQGSSVAYSVTWPSTVHGGLQLGGQLSMRNTSTFVSDGTILIGVGAIINQ